MDKTQLNDIKSLRDNLYCLEYVNKISKAGSIKGHPMHSVTAYQKRKCRCINCKEWARMDSIYRYHSNEYRKAYNSIRTKKWYSQNSKRKLDLGRIWNKNNPEKVAGYDRKRRALEKGNGFEKYSVLDVLEKYGESCFICKNPIDLSATRMVGRGDWEYGLHIDHLIPIAKGGPDTLENVRPTHGICNVKKGAR